MPLEAGRRLGAYEITGPLGAGGMGEVYRARDLQLGRTVAIKVLPDPFASDPERVSRFQREAQVLASLNHPHIAAIYGLEESDGIRALVLEFVEGPTLADRLAGGPVPMAEALDIAHQTATAVGAAHDKGVIHRDLKPANIKLTNEGKVKVLDFGLAKLLQNDQPSSSLSLSPTLSLQATSAGLILGTAAYMSPEQARGKAVDRRSDVWAFGCVLFELLTAQQAFPPGETVSDAVAAILTREPDWSALPSDTPASVRRLLRRCLSKDPNERLHDINDARLEIAEGLVPAAREVDVRTRPARATRGALIAAAATAGLLIAAAFAAGRYVAAPIAAPRVIRSELVPPDTLQWDPSGRIAVSPDGRRLAFLAAGPSGRRMLWVRTLETVSAQPLAGTEDATSPFWSPDSRALAFVADGKLKRIDAAGGSTMTLADAAGLGAWGRDDVILYPARNGSTPLFRVPASGGTPAEVTKLDKDELRHHYPVFLPDGRRFIFVASRSAASSAPATTMGVFLGSLDSPSRSELMTGGSNVALAANFMLFARGTTLLAQPFDADRGRLTGEPMPLAEGLLTTPGGMAAFTTSTEGTLVYQSGTVLDPMVWIDRSGARLARSGEPALYFDPKISPDGRRVVSSVETSTAGAGRDIWMIDRERGLSTRLTFDAAQDVSPIWSPDGRSIVFASDRAGHFDLYRKDVTGSAPEELVFADDYTKTPYSWSADGKLLLYVVQGTGGLSDIWMLPMTPSGKPSPFLATPFVETQPEFSPDGRWIAYTSSESGRLEVYVVPFPQAPGKWQVSSNTGSWPRWRRDGQELYYRSQQMQKIVAVTVTAGRSSFEVSSPHPLFSTSFIGAGRFRYDVAADGQRFLINATNDENETPLTLMLNWPASLHR